jgi:hypothetical protein
MLYPQCTADDEDDDDDEKERLSGGMDETGQWTTTITNK